MQRHATPYLLLLPLLALLALAHPKRPQLPAPQIRGWEYRVVGLEDLHDTTLSHLREALEEKGSLLERALAPLKGYSKKTEDLLNELGQEGWELVHYSQTSMILKRPR